MPDYRPFESEEIPRIGPPTPATPKYPILDFLSIPGDVLETWQVSTNLLAELVRVPVALIMRVHPREIEVFVSSDSLGNIYVVGERANLDTGLYCETVMDTQRALCVPNALEDPNWDSNPDIELGMISYYGLPLTWPTGEIFGTFCVLDIKKNTYKANHRQLIQRFRDSIQLSIASIYQNHLNTLETQRAKDQVDILTQALEQSPVSVMITDANSKIEYVNIAFEKISGYSANEVLGQTPRMFQSGKTPISLYKDLWKTITSQGTWEGEIENRRKSGELYWERAHIGPILDKEGNTRYFLAIKEDVTNQKEQAAQIQHQAFYDPLTDLPNRALVLDRLSQLLIESKRNEKRLAILFLDLDNFKKVNDSLGHIEGDNLLIQAAHRLRHVVREGDTVGRLGGDEFVVLLGGIVSANDVLPVAENLLSRFNDLFQLNGRDFVMTASLGIAVYPEDGLSGTDLLRNADTAMYQAKEQGRNTYCFFTDEMNEDVSRRLLIEEQLRGALARGEFHVCYQPLVDVRTQTTISAEALLRWNNHILGSVPPGEFIPIAEQTQLIDQIGRYVISEALFWAAHWKEILQRDFKIAVNLSPRQFRDLELVPFIEESLKQSGITGGSLELEITEGVLMQGHSHVNQALTAINHLGIGIAMDDFGTGYSSLYYLRRYPFNVLKIDQSFIKDINVNPADRILVKTAIAMAHGLGLEVVAEGVETKDQLEQLASQNCDMAQGNLLGRPVHPEELTNLISHQIYGNA